MVLTFEGSIYFHKLLKLSKSTDFYKYIILFKNQPYCNLGTLISQINVESRLLILKKKIHPPRTFPPSTFIDFLDFFHPPLHVYCIYVLVFSKNSHPPHLFQPPRLLILQLLHSLHVYSNLHGY